MSIQGHLTFCKSPSDYIREQMFNYLKSYDNFSKCQDYEANIFVSYLYGSFIMIYLSLIHIFLREMEKNEYLQQLYEQWLIYKQDIHSTYKDELLERLPLLEQKEFRSCLLYTS